MKRVQKFTLDAVGDAGNAEQDASASDVAPPSAGAHNVSSQENAQRDCVASNAEAVSQNANAQVAADEPHAESSVSDEHSNQDGESNETVTVVPDHVYPLPVQLANVRNPEHLRVGQLLARTAQQPSGWTHAGPETRVFQVIAFDDATGTAQAKCVGSFSMHYWNSPGVHFSAIDDVDEDETLRRTADGWCPPWEAVSGRNAREKDGEPIDNRYRVRHCWKLLSERP